MFANGYTQPHGYRAFDGFTHSARLLVLQFMTDLLGLVKVLFEGADLLLEVPETRRQLLLGSSSFVSTQTALLQLGLCNE